MKNIYNLFRKTFSLTLAILFMACAIYAQTNYYVSPSGNDANSGLTAGSAKKTIQNAINTATAGDTINLAVGTYGEQVLVNKSVTVKGAGILQSIVDYTGIVTGKPTLFDISKPNVSIENIAFNVDMAKLNSAIIASATNISNLTIKNNSIVAYGSSAAATFGSYGNRNAISINYSGATNYRVASGGVNNVQVTRNSISGVANDGFGQARYFRSGVSMDEGGGTFNGNTIQSINHDVLVRFGGNGAINITNNNMNGGGVELAEMNAGAGTLTVSGNVFDATFSNIAAPNTAVLRLKNNIQAKTTIISGNTFSNHEWAVSLENYNSATLDNNSFTPLAGSTGYHHVTINTKTIASNSATILQVASGATLTNNTFNGSGAPGGTALGFYNHDNDAASFGTFVVGTAGNENNFNAGIGKFIYLDHQSGLSTTATFPPYTTLISGAGAITTMAPWAANLNAVNNKYDVGSGLELPASMSNANLFIVEDKVQHKIDLSTLGFVTMKANNDYVTPNSFVSPSTTAGSIQRGIDAASAGWTVNVSGGNYNEDLAVNKSLTLLGSGYASTTVSGPIGGAASTMQVTAAGAIIDGFTITRDGNNPASWNLALNNAGVAIQGLTNSAEVRNCNFIGNRTGIDINNSNGNNIHNNIIDNNRSGIVFRNQTDNTNVQQNFITNNWTIGVLFLDASGGTNSPVQTALNSTFNNNNISGNWYGDIVDRQSGGSLPAPGTTNIKNFECNWYGTTSPTSATSNSTEPGYAAQIPVFYGGTATAPGGQPNILGPASANIDYVPWLINGMDAQATVGFQPVSGSCTGNSTPPVIVCPADKTINCDESINPSNTGMAQANDNCGGTTISFTDTTTPGSNANNYVITRTWKATDGCNNVSTCTQTIIVNDHTAPALTGTPYAGTTGTNACKANATTAAPFNTTNAAQGYTDNCDGPVTAVLTNTNVTGTDCNWTATYTYYVKDESGNYLDSQSYSNTGSDMTPPSAVCQNVSITLANSSATLTPSMVNNGSFDNCGGTVTLSLSKTSFDCSNIGSNQVTLTVEDACGNTSTCTSTVTVVGALPSCSISVTPSNSTYTGGVPTDIYLGYGPQSATINVTATGGSSFTYAWSGHTASLSCTNCANPVFTPTAPGTYVYTVLVTNNYGCTTICSVTFCVKDIRVPGNGNNGKIYLCHVPPNNTSNPSTLSISASAVAAHLSNHSGDKLGACDQTCGSAVARMSGAERNELGDDVKVYPNPNNGTFTVALPYIEDKALIIVTDVAGKNIQNRVVRDGDGNKQIFNLGDAARGIYFVEIICGDQRFRTKLIIQ